MGMKCDIGAPRLHNEEIDMPLNPKDMLIKDECKHSPSVNGPFLLPECDSLVLPLTPEQSCGAQLHQSGECGVK